MYVNVKSMPCGEKRPVYWTIFPIESLQIITMKMRKREEEIRAQIPKQKRSYLFGSIVSTSNRLGLKDNIFFFIFSLLQGTHWRQRRNICSKWWGWSGERETLHTMHTKPAGKIETSALSCRANHRSTQWAGFIVWHYLAFIFCVCLPRPTTRLTLSRCPCPPHQCLLITFKCAYQL